MAGKNMQRETEIVENNSDKFVFSSRECLLFHNTFFFNECEKVIKIVIKNEIRITIT